MSRRLTFIVLSFARYLLLLNLKTSYHMRMAAGR